MKRELFILDTVILFVVYLFMNWRLKNIASEVNNMVKSSVLAKEEKKLDKLVLIMIIMFWIITSIYIFIYFGWK